MTLGRRRKVKYVMLVQVLDDHHQNQVSNFVTYNYGLFSDAYLFLLGMILQKKDLHEA